MLRVPFVIAESNFDPAFASDTYSYTVIDEIFEPPLTYDMLARPYKLKLQTAEAMPEVTEERTRVHGAAQEGHPSSPTTRPLEA